MSQYKESSDSQHEQSAPSLPGHSGFLSKRIPARNARILSGIALSGAVVGNASAVEYYNDNDTSLVDLPQYEVESSSRSLTSPKMTAPIRDIPKSIDVIPSAVIEDQGAASLRDVLRNTPGITFQAGEGGGSPGDNLYIRGFSARTDIFTDGVRDSGDFSRDSFNMEQVEVTKGPSSAQSGRGSTGGSVNLVTKKPQVTSFSSANIEVGTAERFRSTVDLNRILNQEGTSAFRFNAVAQDSGVAGRDEVENKTWGFAPSLSLGLGGKTQVHLNYQHLTQSNLPDYGLWRDATTDENYDWSSFYGLVERDHEDITADSIGLQLDHALNDGLSLRNFTRGSWNVRDAAVTSPRLSRTEPETKARRDDLKVQDRKNSNLTNQTDLYLETESDDLRNTFVTGLELSKERYENFTNSVLGDSPETDLYHPTPRDPWNGAIVRSGAYTDGLGETIAVYGFDTVEIGRHWELTGGLRWERFDADVDAVDADGNLTEFSRVDEMTSWNAGIVYKPAENGSIYASAATSFNPSAEALTLSLGGRRGPSTTDNPDLDPEENRSYEIGTKWEVMDGHLFVNGAVFRTEKTNAYELDDESNLVPAGDRIVEGFELGVSGYLTPLWYLYGGYSDMNSEARSGFGADDVNLPYVPEKSFNLWTTYVVSEALTVGGGAQFTGNYFYSNSNDNSSIPPQASYWLFSGMATYALNDNFSLRLNLQNLTDERYVERGYAAHFTPGPRRSASLTAELRF